MTMTMMMIMMIMMMMMMIIIIIIIMMMMMMMMITMVMMMMTMMIILQQQQQQQQQQQLLLLLLLIMIIIIALKVAFRDFFTISSLRRELSPTHTLKLPGCNRVQMTCNKSNTYHVQHVLLATWYAGTAQLLIQSLNRIYFSFI